MSLRRFLCNITAVAPVLVAEFDWIEKNQAIFEVSSADPARFTKETLYIQGGADRCQSLWDSRRGVVEASRGALEHFWRVRTPKQDLFISYPRAYPSGKVVRSPTTAGIDQNTR